MLRTIKNEKYKQLQLTAQLAARQLFLLQDYVKLADALNKGEPVEELLKSINHAFPAFATNNNMLVQVLMALEILVRPEERQEEVPPEPTPEPPKPSKPKLSIVK